MCGIILKWVENFRLSINANDGVESGRLKTVRTLENVERVRASLLTSPRRSLRKHSQVLNISRESVRLIVRVDLAYHP